MRYRMNSLNRKEEGFVLVTTLIFLLVLSIISVTTYIQVTNSTRSIGISRAKAMASSYNLDTLAQLEQQYQAGAGSLKVNKKPEMPTDEQIGKIVKEYRKSGKYDESGGKFTKFTSSDGNESVATYYYVEQLNSENVGKDIKLGPKQFLYRTVIITFYQGTVDVLESAYVWG